MFRRPSDLLLAFVFATAIAAPLLFTSARHWNQLAERRDPHAKPQLSLLKTDPPAFAAAFTEYFADHFGFRRNFIDLRNAIDFFGFRKSPSPLVTIGKGDWLFYSGARSDEDYAGRTPLRPEQLAQWREAVTRRRNWLAERGATYILLIAPNKQTVYPEYRANQTPKSDKRRAAQLAQSLRGTDIESNVVFAESALLAAKSEADLFYHTDSHWNYRGAYVAYRDVMERLQLLSGITNEGVRFTPKQFVPIVEKGGDLAGMVGFDLKSTGAFDITKLIVPCLARADLQPIAETAPYDIRNDKAFTCDIAPREQRLILFHDSFGNNIFTFFAGSFGRARLSNRYPSDEELKRYVTLEHPTVVVEERSERNLDPPEPGTPVASP